MRTFTKVRIFFKQVRILFKQVRIFLNMCFCKKNADPVFKKMRTFCLK